MTINKQSKDIGQQAEHSRVKDDLKKPPSGNNNKGLIMNPYPKSCTMILSALTASKMTGL